MLSGRSASKPRRVFDRFADFKLDEFPRGAFGVIGDNVLPRQQIAQADREEVTSPGPARTPQRGVCLARNSSTAFFAAGWCSGSFQRSMSVAFGASAATSRDEDWG